jgi:antitoxin HigA-1
MKSSMENPALQIKSLLEKKRLNVRQAALRLKVSRFHLYQMFRGNYGVTPDFALRLERAFGENAAVWVRRQALFDLEEVRRRKGKEIARSIEPLNITVV